MIPFLDLKRQVSSIREEIDSAVREVLNDGWFVLGRRTEEFEKSFAEYCGVSYGIGVGSGTEAIHLALVASGVGAGDEVITVPNTAVPTVSAISFANATPVFVDIDRSTYTMDPEGLEKAITRRTKVILPVHLYGQSADMRPILEIADRYGLTVIEDACQAHGATYGGRKVGSFGRLGCFSFYPSKNLGGCGDGGMVITEDEEMAHRLRLLRNYGQERRYYHRTKGFNSRLDEIQAAVLTVKLKYLDGWNEQRRYLASIYDSLLSEDVIKPKQADDRQHVYHLYVIRTTARDRLQRYLYEKGIETLIHYPVPVHCQDAYTELKVPLGSFPVAEQCAREILSLPLYPELSEDEVGFVARNINNYFAHEANGW